MKTSARRFLSHLSFPLALITALALLLITEISYQRAIAAMDDTSTAFTARLNVSRLLSLMVDAETGQRGYLLTGRDNYLTPYQRSAASIGELLREMARYYTERPAQLEAFTQLSRLITTKISEMDTTVQLKRDGRDDAWRALIDADIGREAQEGIRQFSERLAAAESERLRLYEAQVRETQLISRLGVAIMTVLSLLAFYFYLRQARALITEREHQQRALQAERDTLDRQVHERTEQLTELARYLQTSQEHQRSHLARELHDELGALLTSAKLDVARLQSRLPAIGPEARERIAHLTGLLNSGIALKRRIIEDLRPSALSNLGLVASLDILTREFAASAGLAVDARLEPVRLSPDGELTVYRLVQEALTNVAKYAQARRVEIRLSQQDDGVEISVADDGRGFDLQQMRRGAHGLVGMRYRVEAERGQMTIESRRGQGTRLHARLPSAPTPEAAPTPAG